MVRRGFIKVINKRTGTFVQEELNGMLRLFKQDDWAKELDKRAKMSEDEWLAYSGASVPEDDEEKEEKTGVVAGVPKKTATKKAASKKVSTQKKVVDNSKGDTLIEEDDENDSDEIKA